MSQDLVKVEINGQEFEARKGEMLIQVTDRHGITVPRFCYHEKLTVAANCRMCLVEVEKAPKPLPACATPVMDGMKAYTRSPKAIAAQKAVMEFLLINHPLDCPICDQGGECELQDVALGFGSAVSQYTEAKRIIKDENLGPLISTEMTRCIHCTRCVRFGTEIAGVQELGGTGRGEFMLINTYVGKTVDHELSGNVIDLCPVGALTSKPFRFRARAWEMNQLDTVSPHDGVGANLHAHVSRGRLLRVVPRANEAVNETWIADRDRYSYEGVYAADRLSAPQLRDAKGGWADADWERALESAADLLKRATGGDFDQLGIIASPNATTEEAFLLAELGRKLGCENLDHRLRQLDFSDDANDPAYHGLGQGIDDLERQDAILVVGANLRKDAPLVAHRVRKAALNGANVSFVNPRRFDYLFPVAEQVVVKPSKMVGALQKILDEGGFRGEGRKTVLVGRLAFAHPQFSEIRRLAAAIAQASGATLSFLPDGGNPAGVTLAGMRPRGNGLDARAMFERPRKAYILFGVEPELDSVFGAEAITALKSADAVVVLNPFATDTMRQYAHALLPVGTWAETAGTFINAAGASQSFVGVTQPVGQSRPGWKVLRVLANLMGVEGFEYEAIEEVRAATAKVVGLGQDGSRPMGPLPQFKGSAKAAVGDGLEVVPGFGLYSGDPVVRRAPALQKTRDAADDRRLRIHPETAQALGTAEGEQVIVAGKAPFDLTLDASVAPGTLWLPVGTDAARKVPGLAGSVTVERSGS